MLKVCKLVLSLCIGVGYELVNFSYCLLWLRVYICWMYQYRGLWDESIMDKLLCLYQ